jgi:hypothetical protein
LGAIPYIESKGDKVMRKQNESVLLLCVLLSVWLSACAPASTPIPPTITAVPTTPISPTITAVPTTPIPPTITAVPTTPIPPTITPGGPFPTGSYKAVIPHDVSDLVFLEDGTFTRLLRTENYLIPGHYEVTGDKIVLNEDRGTPCFGYPGTYTWSFDGKTLTLKVVEDNCDFPRGSNLSRSWTKQP